MGLFDEIKGKIKCPKCSEIFEAKDQVKWTNNCWMETYSVGDYIGAMDGEYDYGSLVRNVLFSFCPNCGVEVHFKAIVMNGKLHDLVSTDYKELE